MEIKKAAMLGVGVMGIQSVVQIDKLTPWRTIFASNSFHIINSKFCDVIKYPEKS